MKGIKSAVSSIRMSLPPLSLPSLGREVPIPVYLVHNSPDAEDYFFIFDFEEFVERSREGMFVRPKLQVWAGRDDFDRAAFARQFRVSFSKQFDNARKALASEQTSGGWFNWISDVSKDLSMVSWHAFVAHIVLLISLSAGRKVFTAILPTGLFSGKDPARKLEDSIEDTKRKVDTALQKLEVVLHWELCAHAFYGQKPAHFNEQDYDTWPLPEFVKTHLDDKEAQAFW